MTQPQTQPQTASAVVIRLPSGLFAALMSDGPDAGRWWMLDGRNWTVGEAITVRYSPEDQFATKL